MALAKTGLGSALLGGALAALHLSPGYVTERVIASDASVPWTDRITEVIVLAQGFLDAIGFVVGVGAVFLLGYWAGGRIALRRRYREFLTAVGLGGLIGYGTLFLLFVAYAFLFGAGPLHGEQLRVTAVIFTGRAIAVPVQFAVVGLAGASMAELTADARRSDAASSRSIE